MSDVGQPLLELDGLSKSYGSVTVVQQCDLSVLPGEIHALLGANGAGKSTLVRMVAGLVTPSGGQMRFSSEDYAPTTKKEAELRGIEIVQQELNLIPTLTVAENLFFGRFPSRFGVVNRRKLICEAREALAQFGLEQIDPAMRLGTLGVGQQQIIEIAAALSRNCRLLILDEPTAALSAGEVENLFQWLDRLRDQGVAIVYISHRLDEVKRMADRCSVLRDGKLVATFETSSKSTGEMVELMSGETSEAKSHTSHKTMDEILRVDQLCGGPVKNVSFNLQKGERLGIAGLVGSGRTELLRLIFGADRLDSGSVYLHGNSTPRNFRSPTEATQAGIAMVTEDRKDNGLLLSQSIRSNISLPSLRQTFSRLGLIQNQAETQCAEKHRGSLEIRCNGVGQSVSRLSGGNQQKVAIAKWLEKDADVFLFDEPTRGIDVAARRRIYQLFEELAVQGKGIVIVSSDNEELLEVCDRIIVMSNGELVAKFERGEWSSDLITQAAFSGYLEKEAKA